MQLPERSNITKSVSRSFRSFVDAKGLTLTFSQHACREKTLGVPADSKALPTESALIRRHLAAYDIEFVTNATQSHSSTCVDKSRLAVQKTHRAAIDDPIDRKRVRWAAREFSASFKAAALCLAVGRQGTISSRPRRVKKPRRPGLDLWLGLDA